MHEVLVNRLGGLSLPRKSVVRLTDRSDMTLNVYRGRKTKQTKQKTNNNATTTKNVPHLSVLAFGIYPRMTSFSDPKSIYYTNSDSFI